MEAFVHSFPSRVSIDFVDFAEKKNFKMYNYSRSTGNHIQKNNITEFRKKYQFKAVIQDNQMIASTFCKF